MKTQSILQRTLQALFITGISIFALAPALGQDLVQVTGDNYVRGEGPGTAAAEQPEVHGPADTSSPRATLKSFLDAMNEIYGLIESRKFLDRSDPQYRAIAMRALDTLDTSDLPAFARVDRAGEAALYLKEILDRLEVPPWEDIPDQTAIEAAGGPEQLPLWRIPGMRITIGMPR